jgi:hypothetical protein
VPGVVLDERLLSREPHLERPDVVRVVGLRLEDAGELPKRRAR